jgi:hypothetical protein
VWQCERFRCLAATQDLEEQADGAFTDLPHWLRYRCQRRIDYVREANVVETND